MSLIAISDPFGVEPAGLGGAEAPQLPGAGRRTHGAASSLNRRSNGISS
jgi:hypothetical protein